MEINTYSGTEVTKKELNFVASAVAMKKYSSARQVLPKDTIYAIVAEVVERGRDESFDEVDVVTAGGIPVGAKSSNMGGLRGRYMCYISVGDGKFRVQTADGQLVVEEPLQNIHVSFPKEQLNVKQIINTPDKKFLPGTLAVIDPNPDFKSEVKPGRIGIYPLFDLLAAGGATIESISPQEIRRLYRKGLTIFFVIAGAMIAIPLLYFIISILTGR